MSHEPARKGPVIHRWITVVLLVVMALASVRGVVVSVALIDFYAVAGEKEIFLFWETASETGTLGFYVERSTSPDSGFELIEVKFEMYGETYTDTFIPAYGDAANYEVIDINARLGTRYYYLLQEYPADGNVVDLALVSARIEPDWQVVLPMVFKQ